MSRLFAIDTNLLVLLIVGTASEGYIGKHKRTAVYTVDDYQLLKHLLAGADGLVFTPHVLTETSNLIRQFANPGRDVVWATFRNLVVSAREVMIRSTDALQRVECRYLGLTDAAMLELDATGPVLLTDDFDLYRASLAAGRKPLNFAHARETWLGL